MTNQLNKFHLTSDFIASYESRPPPFGYNGLGELVYKRTYSRVKPNGLYEKWHETLERVVNATYNIQLNQMRLLKQDFDYEKAQGSAQEMYDRMFNMKFLPPGRGLWCMGSAMTEERHIYAGLYNCGFVSTEHMLIDPVKPFAFLMDMSMLGVGVGFDVKGANTVRLHLPFDPILFKRPHELIPIEDSREGWVAALSLLLSTFFLPNQHCVYFDYHYIRPAGLPIKGFGGISSGPEPLRKLLTNISDLLSSRSYAEPTYLTLQDIMDIMNMIGKCVIAGNVRRTAEIAFGPATDEYLDLKNPVVYPIRNSNEGWSWTSNNSVFATVGMNYDEITKRICINGEPGLAWIDNMREYGLMGKQRNYLDTRAMGGNPCLEQTLESYELCCLVETFPHHHTSSEDFLKTLKYAYLFAKTVSLCETHWEDTNHVMRRNRRIGCSISGVAQFVAHRNLDELKTWLTQGYTMIHIYDDIYSAWFQCNRSIKTTSVKPSGTVSLLAGATPGMHWPEAHHYIRRVRLAADSPLIEDLQKHGYHLEPDVKNPQDTMIVEFPIELDQKIRTTREVSMWEQLSMAAFLQRYWSDNQVSCTVTFHPKNEGPQISAALNYFQYQLKGVSFLPQMEFGSYPQMPYEAITAAQYQEKILKLSTHTLKLSDRGLSDYDADRFCDGSSCQGPSP